MAVKTGRERERERERGRERERIKLTYSAEHPDQQLMDLT